MGDVADYSEGPTTYGSGLSFGGEANAAPARNDGFGADVPQNPITAPVPVPETPVAQSPAGAGVKERGGIFGSGITLGAPAYTTDPQLSALDQSADMLQQRVKRANEVAANPILQFFNPEGVQAARNFVPQAAEALQKIKQQQSAIKAGREQAATLGLAPGETPDEASLADRVEVAKGKALKGDLRVFKGLQAVDPKTAEAIQDQVFEQVGSHLTKAQLAFDSLSGMQNQGQYGAKLRQLRADGTLGDLEALGLKVPDSFDAFTAVRAKEGMALREARIGLESVRQKLEERNTYQPMEKKDAETYNGRLTTVHGDQITNGTWGRNAAAGTRGLIVNGAADPRDLGKKFTLASPEQRKAIREEAEGTVPKAELEKHRSLERIGTLATKDVDGREIPPEGLLNKKGERVYLNTNPNIQQGLAEGFASALRGGMGGATGGLLKIETDKRGAVQGLLDSLKSAYAGGINTITGEQVKAYLTPMTQKQQREVLDGLRQYNDAAMEDRIGPIARRAGALGLDTTALGWGKSESEGVIEKQIAQGTREQIERMLPNHQAIGGGDGVFQLGAQRPGTGAVQPPAGSGAPTTQLPGQPPVATPVQQAQQSAPTTPPVVPSPGGGSPPSAGASPAVQPPLPPGSGPSGGGAPPAPTPVTIAGQQVNAPMPPGASPKFIPALARIESGNVKDPWTAQAGKGPDGKQLSSASGAYQMLDSTWEQNKPPGATAKRAKDATPEQQTAAFATLTARNAKSLEANGLPLNDTTLYMAHNLGAGGAASLLQAAKADPNADARAIVGEAAARNNPTFFKGRPTVAKVLERYQAEMDRDGEPQPKSPLPGSAGATAEAPGLMTRISRMLSQGVQGGDAGKDKAVREVGEAATEHAPAIGSTLGAVGGSVAGPAGTVAGGAAGGGLGQSLKDWLQGRDQNPTEIAKQTALGGVLGVGTAARPVVGALARTGGAAAVEGGAAAIEGKDAGEIAEAAGKGGALAAGGEAFGRALGMVGHKVFNMFAPESKAAVQTAAGKYAEAEAVLAKEAPTIPGAAGAKATPNPKYLTAEADKLEAERVLKDAGLKPEEAAYAHKVSTEGVPKQEAQAAKPGALEEARVGAGYDQLRDEVGAATKNQRDLKAVPKLADGPRAVAEASKMSPALQSAAERTEMAITAPTKNWQEKWVQLQDARSALLELERDAASSTTAGRTQLEKDYRALADSVRKQQEKAAKYVFGEKDGAAFIDRLKVLDVRYRRLMEATNGGDLAKAAALKGEAGRDADRKFRAFAHDDPAAIAAWNAMKAKGANLEQGVHDLVAAERIPVLGKVFSAVKLMGSLNRWTRERAAGSPVKFSDIINTDAGAAGVNQSVRDLAGTAAQRGAVMQ